MGYSREELWSRARRQLPINLEDLPGDVARCITEGDGLFDHYGGRAPVCFVEADGNEWLALESMIDPHAVRPLVVLNASGGYGTGILGGAVTELRRQSWKHCTERPT